MQRCKICSQKEIKDLNNIAGLGLCYNCSYKVIAYNRYYDSNIPIEYWDLNMPTTNDDSFKGSKELLKIYLDSISNIKHKYDSGMNFCMSGLHGTGKTTVSVNILKKAVRKGFTALYSTLNEIVSALTLAPNDEKYAAKKELTEVDFLVIDELDARHIGTSEQALDLFGRNFEHILRTRLQNKLPIIIVSNSPNPIETFSGSLKESLSSLMTKLPFIPILGEDIRKMQAKEKI